MLYFLQFDFNPMNLRSPRVESIATYLDLSRDPASGSNSVQVLAPSLADAQRVAERLTDTPPEPGPGAGAGPGTDATSQCPSLSSFTRTSASSFA